MAPKPVNSSKVELHESEITKPQPLRIIKRSQTVSGISHSRSAFRERGSSGSSCESNGSPPFGADRPLTVRKKRQERASLMGFNSDYSGSDCSTSSNKLALADLVKDYHALSEMMNDPEVTPKANKNSVDRQRSLQTPRTISAGDFLKNELYRPTSDIEAERYSVRGQRRPRMYEHLQNFHQHTSQANIVPFKVPERRPSKSKNFLLRAIGMRSSDEPPKHLVRRVGSASSKHTLIRHASREKQVEDDSLYKDFGFLDSCHSSIIESSDIADVNINSGASSRNTSSTSFQSSSPPSAGLPSAFVLCPQITITPEVSSVETGPCSLWVAVLITGALQRADGYRGNGTFSQSFNDQLLEFASYGRLHNMRIEIIPGPGCKLIDLVGDLHTATAMQAGGTRLVAAKLVLEKCEPSLRIKDTISDNLMAELENDLGHTLTPYLSVRLTYRHSSFPQLKPGSMASQGLTSHVTNLQTEATAVIKRHNPQSAWSPRTSQTMDLPLLTNPVKSLIETHLPADQARDALRRFATERAPISLVRRFQHFGGSSEETIKPCSIIAKTMPAISTSPVQATSRTSKCSSHVKMNSSPLSAITPAHMVMETDREEVDPARKIWTEMRRHSRGGQGRQNRTSISADHYYSFADDCSPSRVSSSEVSISSLESGNGTENGSLGFEGERSRIMEMALRNKRSVGADTLRSIAPSLIQSAEKKTGINGVGLGVGRSWGWGHSWW